MCSREELLRQLIAEASVLTDEEVEEVLEYAKREFEAAVEEGKKGKKLSPADYSAGLSFYIGLLVFIYEFRWQLYRRNL